MGVKIYNSKLVNNMIKDAENYQNRVFVAKNKITSLNLLFTN